MILITSKYLTSDTVADHKDEHADMREEDIGDDFPDGLTLLHVELVLFAHLVSVIYEFVFVFRNVKNIFFSSYFLVSHINTTLLVTINKAAAFYEGQHFVVQNINYYINIGTIFLFVCLVSWRGLIMSKMI